MRLGESLEGTLLDIDDECLIISAHDSEIILEAEAITKVERLSSSGNGASAFTGTINSPALPAVTVFPAAASQSLATLERQVRAVTLEVGPPEWNVWTDDLQPDVRVQLDRDLNSVRSRYENALKAKYTDRILECVGRLRAIAGDYDAPDILQIAGRILWRYGDRGKARDLFAEATDALNDSSSSFDLAMAQRGTDERELAPDTLRSCLSVKSSARSVALMALTAIALTEDVGRECLAGVVADAGHWQPGPVRLAVLHCGLLCVPRPSLTGFPVEQWNSQYADAGAFEIVAQALRSASATGPDTGSQGQNRDAPTIPHSEGPATAPPPAVDISELTATLYVSLNRRDLPGAGRALTELKRTAPRLPATVEAERAVAYARKLSAPKPSASKTPPPSPASGLAKTAFTPASVSAKKAVIHSTESANLGPMRRAEEAIRRRSWNQARQLLEQAIAEGDNPARAVRRLAELLSTRLKDRAQAAELLRSHKHLFQTEVDLWAWSQLHSTVLEHAGRWAEATDELRDMIDRAPTYDTRIKIIKRTTAALIKISKPDEAKELLERELEGHPDETALQAILGQLNQAMVTGVYSIIEATLQEQVGATSELSPLLVFHLERCQYWGVRAESLARHAFTMEDIDWLDNLVSGGRRRVLDRDRPRERAEANLSAARIMQDLGITDDDFRRRLRFFANAMGDACVIDARGNADVIRAYYAEAVSLKGEWDDTINIMLRQLVMSFVIDDVKLLDIQKLPTLEGAMTRVMSEKHLTDKVLVTLLALPTQSETAKHVIKCVWNDKTTRVIFQKALTAHLDRSMPVSNQKSFTEAWLAAADQDRNRRRIYREIAALAESGPALPVLDRHSDQLKRISQEVHEIASVTDLARIADCLSIVTSLREYLSQSAYVERERMSGSARTAILDKVKEFEEAPTVLSLSVLHPYLRALEEELAENFTQYAAHAEPDKLTVEQVVNRYLPSGGMVTVQLQVSNGPDASPVSNVELEVVPNEDYHTTEGRDIVPIADSIAAGQSRTCQVSLVASRHAIEQELITLNCRVHFTVRSQRRVVSPVGAHSIRLHPDEEWTEIPNPYSAGLPVENPDMFKGRDQLIADLVSLVGGDERGSVIVYGQKRAGKSSVLLHLQQKLTLPYVAVRFSVPELESTSITFNADLLYAIAAQIHRALRNIAEDGKLTESAPPRPDIGQIRLAAVLNFNDYMDELHGWLRCVPELAGSRIVLLLDEFTVIHKNIRTGKLPEDFMKSWKAILEKGFFRCVLAGNDLMPRFIDDYPNEFQIALPKRVSFLDPLYARQLIVDPIREPSDGSSRYRGNAVERIVELTGCSPYYIQLFCRELVQYMNRDDVRAPAIGPADVDTVARKMIAELDQTQFDNLLTPGDAEVTDIGADLVMDVLRATRRESGPTMYHEVNVNVHTDAERVIADLTRREVLKRLSGDRYRIRVGIFSEWLQHRWA